MAWDGGVKNGRFAHQAQRPKNFPRSGANQPKGAGKTDNRELSLLPRPVHVPPVLFVATHRDSRARARRDGAPEVPRGCRELSEVSSRRDARHRRLARRVWPPRVRRMHMHRATHTITGMGITIMIKQLVMVMSLMIMMIAQRQAALAVRMVLPPALPPTPTGRRVRLVRAPRRVAARRRSCGHVRDLVRGDIPVVHVSAGAVMFGWGRGSRHPDAPTRSGGGGGGERGTGRGPHAAGEHAAGGRSVSK